MRCLLALLMTLLSALSSNAAAQVIRRTINEVECRPCSIRAHEIVRLGKEGAGELNRSPSSIFLDAAGRYWILQDATLPLVYDAAGAFLGEVSRKGRGPGELTSPRLTWRVPGDSTAILDVGGRVTILDRQLRATRTIQMPVQQVVSVIVRDWPRNILISGIVPTGSGVGWPYHTMDLTSSQATVLKSFGPGNGDYTPRDYIKHRQVIRTRGTSFWALFGHSLRATEWNESDSVVRQLDRTPTWFASESQWSLGGVERPPEPRSAGLMIQQDLLWIFALVPSSGWRRAWDRVRHQIGAGTSEVPIAHIDIDALYDTVVEVVDLKSNQLLATRKIEGRYVSTLDDNSIAVATSSTDHVPMVRVLNLQLVRP